MDTGRLRLELPYEGEIMTIEMDVSVNVSSVTFRRIDDVAAFAPVSLGAPKIVGDLAEGETLTCSAAFAGIPIPAVTYQWQRDTGGGFANIAGATSQTYTLTSSDTGNDVRCQATATNSAGNSGAINSETVSIGAALSAPVASTAPTVSGTAYVGETLTVTPGTYTGNPAPALTYAWEAIGPLATTSIVGESGTSYVIQPDADRKDVRVTETATNSEGTASQSVTVEDITYRPPEVGSIADVVYTQDSGEQAYDVSGSFTYAEGGAWELGPFTPFDIELAVTQNGVVQMPTDQAYNGIVTVRYTNSGGIAEGTFEVTVGAVGNTAPVGQDNTITFVVPEGSGLDTTAPTISSSSPADGATGVAIDADPTITFSEDIAFGTGSVTLRNVTDGTDIEAFDVAVDTGGGAGTVSISGAVLTIEPTSDLPNSKSIAIRIDAGAITDTSASANAFAGISDNTTLNFTTAAASSVSATFIERVEAGNIFATSRTINSTGIQSITGKVVAVVGLGGGQVQLITGLTIAGVAATERAKSEYDDSSLSIWEADITSGNSGDIDITTTNAMDEAGIDLFEVTGTFASKADGVGANSNSPLTFDLVTTAAAGDVIITGGMDAGSNTLSVSGATETANALVNSARRMASAKNDSATGSDTLTWTVNVQFTDLSFAAVVYE